MEREQYERYRALLRALSKQKAQKRGKRFKITDSKGLFIIFTYPKNKRLQLNTAIITQLDKLKNKKNAQLDFINSLDITEVRMPKRPPQQNKKFGGNKSKGRVVIKHKDGTTTNSPVIAKKKVIKKVIRKQMYYDIGKTAEKHQQSMQ